MKVQPTGSQMDRVARCEASAALPQVIDANDDEDGKKKGRDRGSAMHEFLDRVGDVGREVALAEVEEPYRGFCADIQLAKLADKIKLSREVAVAYNFRDDTARLLFPLEHRAYDVDASCEFAMTLDLVGVGPDAVYIGDYKSGHGWLPAPEDSYQLGGGALAIARLYKKNKAVVEYIRIRDDGSVRKFDAEIDVFGLEAAAEKIGRVLGGIPHLRRELEAGIVPDVVEGPWCRYCPAKQHCPAKTALIRHVLNDPHPIPYVAPLTPEGALRLHMLLKPAKEAIAAAEAALYGYAKLTPIPLGVDPDGSLRFFGELRRPGRDVLDGAITHAVIAELYGGEVANKVVTMEVTKKSITDEVRKVLPAGEKITHATDLVYELVGARGGIANPETVSTTEYTVDADGAAKARQRRKAG